MTDANRAAVARFADVDGPVFATILTGPRRSGRSLLARRTIASRGGRVFDRAEDADEEAVFHAWNGAQETRLPLILIADAAPPIWVVRLPDLASRLAATPHLAIGEPDDALFAALLVKLLSARGLSAPTDLAGFVLARVERSYLALHRVVEALDAHLLSRRARLSIPNAREALIAAGVIAQDESGSIPHDEPL